MVANAVGAVGAVAGSDVPFGRVHVGDVGQFLAGFTGSAGGAKGAAKAEGTGSVYNKILAPLTEFRAGFDKILGNISDLVGKGNLSMADLIQVQFQLTQLSYMNDLSAKTADKVSQGVQTLFRNQG
jgi:hypothetical protein